MWIGVRAFGRWINHITIYGMVWGIQVILFEMRLIAYHALSFETTMFIFGSWAVFVFSSLTIRNFYSNKMPETRALPAPRHDVLTIVLVTLTLIGAIGTYQHWTVLLRMFGSVKGVVFNANLMYALRREEGGIPGMWPYVDSVSLAADFVGGYFAGLRRRPILLAVAPFIVELANAIAAFGRSRLLIGIILWGTAFFFTQVKKQATERSARWKQVVLLASILIIFIFGMEFIRQFRGMRESFSGETTSLSHMNGVGLITPSIYLYLSSDVAVLNKFLNYEFSGRVEHTPIGGNTFAPFFRLFAKIGLTDPVLEYQKSYSVPASTNTASYLRELYADWGIGGTLFFVYLLGAFCSVAVEAYRRRKSLTLLAIVAHLHVAVFFSFFVQVSRLGYWIVSLVFAVIASMIIDKYSVHENKAQYGNGDGTV